MPTFQYQAIQADGATVNGLVFGPSQARALTDLQARGLQVSQIDLVQGPGDPIGAVREPVRGTINKSGAAVSATPGYEINNSGMMSQGPATEARNYVSTAVLGPLVGKVSLAHQLFFFNQLGAMMKAGVPIVQTFDTLSSQTQSGKLNAIIKELAGHVQAGRPVSAGIQRYPEVFSPVTLSIIRVGEEAGRLEESLATVSRYIEEEIELRNLYRRVTIYPKILLGASIIIIIAANAIISAVAPAGAKLASPLTNPVTWIFLGPLLVGIFLFMRVGLANLSVRYWWDKYMLKIPYAGKTFRMMATAKFGRAVGAMYQAGVPITKVIQLGADACGNEYMRAQIYPAAKVLESGAGITETMRSTGAISPMVLDMLATGERTGEVDQMLGKMADYYAEESKTRAIQLGHVLGVVILVGVSLYIGYIIINFYTSYYGGLLEMAK